MESEPETAPGKPAGREQEAAMRRWWWGALVVLVGAVVAGSFLAWGPGLPFDSQAWLALEDPTGPLWSMMPARDNRRARMVDDLLASHLHPGAAWPPLQKLLGRPGAGGDGTRLYDLLWRPSPDQQLVAWLRWHTTNPALDVEIAQDASGGHVVDARVR
jgi:hypothetical protein